MAWQPLPRNHTSGEKYTCCGSDGWQSTPWGCRHSATDDKASLGGRGPLSREQDDAPQASEMLRY